jgi:hypothetical protein
MNRPYSPSDDDLEHMINLSLQHEESRLAEEMRRRVANGSSQFQLEYAMQIAADENKARRMGVMHNLPMSHGPRYEDPRHEDPRHEYPRHEDPRHEDPRHEPPRVDNSSMRRPVYDRFGDSRVQSGHTSNLSHAHVDNSSMRRPVYDRVGDSRVQSGHASNLSHAHTRFGGSGVASGRASNPSQAATGTANAASAARTREIETARLAHSKDEHAKRLLRQARNEKRELEAMRAIQQSTMAASHSPRSNRGNSRINRHP